jgi:hypothetical protein
LVCVRGPAFHCNASLARIKRNRDAVRKLSRGISYELRIAHCGSADDHAIDALCKPGLDACGVANAAAELNRHAHGLSDAHHRVRIGWTALNRAVKVDQVEVGEPLRFKDLRLRCRVSVKNCCARHVALFQAHALAGLQIDSRE